MDRLGVGMLSVFGLAPVKLVNLAADLGCHYVSTALQGMPLVPLSYPRFSLTDDAGLRQSVLAAMNDRGVTIPLGDGFLVLPGSDVSAFGTDLDVLAELGVPRINVVSLDPDLPRSFDQFAALTELAAEPGIQTLLEPVPDLTVGEPADGARRARTRGAARLPLADRHHASDPHGFGRRRSHSDRPGPHRLCPTQRHHAPVAQRKLPGRSHV